MNIFCTIILLQKIILINLLQDTPLKINYNLNLALFFRKIN